MCCLFGIYDYGHSLTAAQKKRLVSALAVASEDRGTDATGDRSSVPVLNQRQTG